MKRTLSITAIIVLASVTAAWPGAAGLVKINTMENRILSGEISMDKYFDAESVLRRGDDLRMSEDIYEFGAKSPFKAFVFSLAVPGAGEYYTGHKYKAVGFFTADALFWTGYFIYRGKGKSTEDDYKAYANEHYSWRDFMDWWQTLPPETQNIYSHRMPFDFTNYVPIFNHEYFENIGKYDQFQVGWPGGINHPYLPNSPDTTYHESWMPVERQTYLDMRKKSNDYFARATTMMMVSIANHIVSAFDAAIGAKRFNRGSKQYSMKVDAKEINGETVPFVTLSAKF